VFPWRAIGNSSGAVRFLLKSRWNWVFARSSIRSDRRTEYAGGRTAHPAPARRLNPVFDIVDGQFVMATQFMAAVPTRELRERIGSLADHHDAIMNALDMIFTGF
jgi:hypothetical protein